MRASRYVPARGEFVWLEFNPQAGHEQAGRGPALTISPREYNRKTGLALFCPVTSQAKGYPFEVLAPPGRAVRGVILSDQIKSLDWRVRRARFIDRAPPALVSEVLAKAVTLLS
ncbi:MAG: endoribonuclease MazF [Planctomycetes bacterium]|nr:endoribonuclease MazF [Planctomycetota bacterium]